MNTIHAHNNGYSSTQSRYELSLKIKIQRGLSVTCPALPVAVTDTNALKLKPPGDHTAAAGAPLANGVLVNASGANGPRAGLVAAFAKP